MHGWISIRVFSIVMWVAMCQMTVCTGTNNPLIQPSVNFANHESWVTPSDTYSGALYGDPQCRLSILRKDHMSPPGCHPVEFKDQGLSQYFKLTKGNICLE